MAGWRRSGTTAAMCAALVACLTIAAAAHDAHVAGPYRLVIGWGDEPAFTAMRNTVTVEITDAGKALVRACNELRLMLDLSHLNEAGFWDVASLSDAPLVASHSNAHALCPCSRNLTDRQLDAIRESGGLVGLNLAVSFLRPDGRNDADTPLATLCEHVEHLVGRLGVDQLSCRGVKRAGIGHGKDVVGHQGTFGVSGRLAHSVHEPS